MATALWPAPARPLAAPPPPARLDGALVPRERRVGGGSTTRRHPPGPARFVVRGGPRPPDALSSKPLTTNIDSGIFCLTSGSHRRVGRHPDGRPRTDPSEPGQERHGASRHPGRTSRVGAGAVGRAAAPAQATHNGSGTAGADSLALHVGPAQHDNRRDAPDPGQPAAQRDSAVGNQLAWRGCLRGFGRRLWRQWELDQLRRMFGRSTNSVGVSGYSVAPAANPAFPLCGVSAFADNNHGLLGGTGAAANLGMAGVFGRSHFNGSPGGGSFGVRGESTSGTGTAGQSNSGAGVHGSSNGNVGVLGVSNASVGVYAASTSSTGLDATSGSAPGSSPAPTAERHPGRLQRQRRRPRHLEQQHRRLLRLRPAPASTPPAPSGFAARFDGPVLVNGNFTAIGGSKSAAVPHPDGTHRRLYCVESPESCSRTSGARNW